MARTTALFTTIALGTLALAPAAQAEPMIPRIDPFDITFEVGEKGDGGRAWSSTVTGDFTQQEFSEDGLLHHTVAAYDRNVPMGSDLHPDEDPGRTQLGKQNDEAEGWALHGCPEPSQAAGPATFTSEDDSFLWEPDPEFDPFEDDVEDLTGEYRALETRALDEDARAIEVEAFACLPEGASETHTHLYSVSYFVRTGETEFTRVASASMPMTANEGSAFTWYPEPGWEFIEELSDRKRPGGLTDAEWADQLVAEGVVPAEKRWYVANEEAPGQDDGGEGPIVDTGYRAGGGATPFALGGMTLLAVGGAVALRGLRRG